MVFGQWMVLAELADGPAGCGELRKVSVYLLELQCDKVNRPYVGGDRRSGPNTTPSLL